MWLHVQFIKLNVLVLGSTHGDNLHDCGWVVYMGSICCSLCVSDHSLCITLQSDLMTLKKKLRVVTVTCVIFILFNRAKLLTFFHWEMTREKLKRIRNCVWALMCLLNSLKILIFHDVSPNYNYFMYAGKNAK